MHDVGHGIWHDVLVSEKPSLCSNRSFTIPPGQMRRPNHPCVECRERRVQLGHSGCMSDCRRNIRHIRLRRPRKACKKKRQNNKAIRENDGRTAHNASQSCFVRRNLAEKADRKIIAFFTVCRVQLHASYSSLVDPRKQPNASQTRHFAPRSHSARFTFAYLSSCTSVSEHNPQYIRSACAAMKTPAPHIASGHSRRSRSTFPSEPIL